MTGLRTLLAGLILCVPLAVAADGQRTPQPKIVIEKAGSCIAPVEEMRRNHPDMLKHQRYVTVHTGTRGARVRLNACIECHANRVNGSVVGSNENFCQGCHQFVGVRLDCFECHQPSPAAGRASLVTAAPQP